MTQGRHYDPEHEDLYGSRRSRSSGSRNRNADDTGSWSELQRAVDRFEQAVQDLVGSATSEFSGRATAFLNETTAKIEREFSEDGRPRDYRESDAAARMRARRRARARARSERILERSARLTRDDEHAKIAGVCAGIANYYGVEHWVVRCAAVTGLLFFPGIVFPAYWIMYFVMEGPRDARRRAEREGRSTDRTSEREAAMRDRQTAAKNPRRNLRNVQADLQEVELRLRRMETHVTSGQYELQRELAKIESEPPPAGSAPSAAST
ncbi:MAG: PspC domain-containing protein [Pseudomonadales bacterium]